MPEQNDIRIRKIGRGARLEIWSGGRWYSTPMDFTKRINQPKPKILETKKTLRKEVARFQPGNTQIGLSGGDKANISLKTRITYLQGVATNRKSFQLNMGTNGQEKILIVTHTASGTNYPEITLKTQQDDSTKYTSTKNGQVLHLVCDGTYWYLFSTGYSTSGSHDAGEWSTT